MKIPRLLLLPMLILVAPVSLAQGESGQDEVSTEGHGEEHASDEHGSGEHHGLPHQHFALLVGAGLEVEDGHRESGVLAGLEYQYQFHERWGAVTNLEWLIGESTNRSWLFAVLASYHPNERWQFLAGPGFESHDGHKKPLARLSVGYDIPLKGRRVFTPAFIADYGEGGKWTFVLAAAIGLEF